MLELQHHCAQLFLSVSPSLALILVSMSPRWNENIFKGPSFCFLFCFVLLLQWHCSICWHSLPSDRWERVDLWSAFRTWNYSLMHHSFCFLKHTIDWTVSWLITCILIYISFQLLHNFLNAPRLEGQNLWLINRSTTDFEDGSLLHADRPCFDSSASYE